MPHFYYDNNQGIPNGEPRTLWFRDVYVSGITRGGNNGKHVWHACFSPQKRAISTFGGGGDDWMKATTTGGDAIQVHAKVTESNEKALDFLVKAFKKRQKINLDFLTSIYDPTQITPTRNQQGWERYMEKMTGARARDEIEWALKHHPACETNNIAEPTLPPQYFDGQDTRFTKCTRCPTVDETEIVVSEKTYTWRDAGWAFLSNRHILQGTLMLTIGGAFFISKWLAMRG